MTTNRTVRDKIWNGSHHISVLTTTVAFALARGHTMSDIEAVTGLDSAVLGDPDARPPAEVAHRLWDALKKAEPNTPLGVEASRAASLGALGGMMHGMQYAATLRDAMEFLIRNRAVLANRLEIALIETADEARLEAHHPADRIDDGYVSEVGAGLLVRLFREVLGLRVPPIRVELLSEPLGPEKAYRDFFRCPVQFGADRAALVYSREVVAHPVRTADPTLFAFVERHFEFALARIAASDDPPELALLRQAIAAAAAAGDYRADNVARRAGLTLRTAQRRAAVYNRSLQTMIEEARLANAQAFLKDETMTVAQAAGLLGFSDERAFRRAYKRWTGITPSAYRRRPSSTS
ncbi:MAG: AraC family transcriptional regulator ligand-binding domain-containing protein [Pseudomonadota bacterium]